jgi:hypothetical protein
MTYIVRSIDWNDILENAVETTWAYDEESAAREWCEYHDRGGNFVGDYPDGHEVEVVAEDGTASRFTIYTDWNPHFCIHQQQPGG